MLDSAQQLQELAAIHMDLLGNKQLLSAYQDLATPGGSSPISGSLGAILRPWIDEPDGSVPFDEQFGVALPVAFGVETVVLSFQVPIGYDGVIKAISNNFLGGGFVDFSGDIRWRILADGKPIRNFSNILANKGTIAAGRIISPIRVYSGQVINYIVNHIANVGLVGQVVCSLNGYIYPSGKSS